MLEEHRDREHEHAKDEAASDHHVGSPADLPRVELEAHRRLLSRRRPPGEVSGSPLIFRVLDLHPGEARARLVAGRDALGDDAFELHRPKRTPITSLRGAARKVR